MNETAPFWSAAELISESVEPADFQVSLEDIISNSGRLTPGELSSYSAKGTPFVEGDVLFGKLRPYLGKYWLADREGTAGGDIHVYRPSNSTNPRFLRYVVSSENFIKFAEASSKGTKMPRAEWISLREFRIQQYDLEAQRRIADYLDRETGEIDAMIDKLDGMVHELTQRRARVIQQKTIRNSKPLTRLKFCADVSLGKTFQGVQKKPDERFVNYVRAASIQPYGLELDDQRMWMTDDELSKYNLLPNDVLIVEGGAGYGRSVVLAEPMPNWGFQNHVIRVRPNIWHDGRFLNYCVRAHLDAGLIEVLVDGATIPALSSDKARELPLPNLSLAEQRRIADHLDEVTGKIDAMLAKVAELKDLLTERRAALITDVITGRKDVA